MKKILILITFALGLFANEGKELFENNCLQCHIMKKGFEITDKDDLKAPPVFAIVNNIKPIFNNDEQYIEFVVSYLENPSKMKSRCKSDAVKQFGLMPKSVGEKLTKEQKEKVARWLVENIK